MESEGIRAVKELAAKKNALNNLRSSNNKEDYYNNNTINDNNNVDDECDEEEGVTKLDKESSYIDDDNRKF